MQQLSYIADWIDRINDWVGRTVAWLTVLMVLNVFLVVFLRYTFSIGFIWMQETYVWMHAVVFMCAAGYTLLYDGHVRIDVFYRDASARFKASVNLVGSLTLGLPFVWVLWNKGLPIVIRSWMQLEASAEAGGLQGVFLLKSVILVFCVLFGLQFVSLAIRSLLVLLNKPGGEGAPGGKASA